MTCIIVAFDFLYCLLQVVAATFTECIDFVFLGTNFTVLTDCLTIHYLNVLGKIKEIDSHPKQKKNNSNISTINIVGFGVV